MTPVSVSAHEDPRRLGAWCARCDGRGHQPSTRRPLSHSASVPRGL